MIMNISRRFFIGGLASALAMGPRRFFAATPDTFVYGKPDLIFGVISDVHLSLSKDGKTLAKSYGNEHLLKAFKYFRDNGADAVVIAGDMANCGMIGELKAVADAWFKVFPNDTAPDGRKVARIFVTGNHDLSGMAYGKWVYGDNKEAIAANAIVPRIKEVWDECFHEEWKEIYLKDVKGFKFVGANWCTGRCTGKNENFNPRLVSGYEEFKKLLDPAKPFFHVQHPHPQGTVHGNVWGQDDGTSTKVLSAFPNAVSFSGHSHTSLIDEKSIWQGAFTAVGTATLRDVGSSGLCDLKEFNVQGGYENYKTPKGSEDSLKVMNAINRGASKQGQLVRVYGDRIVISRRDFSNDVALTDDMVMPLPASEKKPFAFATRKAATPAPAFADGAKLTVEMGKAKARGAKKKDAANPCVKITIPQAERAVAYLITAQGKDGQPLTVSILSELFRFAKNNKRCTAPAICKIACDRLASGEQTFSVTALSSWGKQSTPLTAKFTIKD